MTSHKPTDIQPIEARMHLLPVQTRLPLKFGKETLTEITCARVQLRVAGEAGKTATGWGETPLSVQWVWPSAISYRERYDAMIAFCNVLCAAWSSFEVAGHAMEVGHAFLKRALLPLLEDFNRKRADREPMPYLAALVCCSAFDIALHDAYGIINDVPTYETYNARYMNEDLAAFLKPAAGADVSFAGQFPEDYLVTPVANRFLRGIWLVERTGSRPPIRMNPRRPTATHICFAIGFALMV